MIKIREKTGYSPFLITGVFSNSLELVKHLIPRGCDVYDKHSDGLTVLHHACQNGKLELVQYLVDNHPDMLTIRDKTGKSPFLETGFSGSVDILKYLISRGCDVYGKDNNGFTILHTSCQEGKLELVQYVVDNYPDMLRIRDKTGQSSFLVAGFSGSVKLLKYLISRGCDVYDKDNEGWTVLHKACNKGELRLVKYLIDFFPDMLTLRDKRGQSPFHTSGYCGPVELVKYLISQECYVNDKDNNGSTILHKACNKGNFELVSYLIDTYPDILTVRDDTRQSPLLDAGFSGSVDLVKYLISKGFGVLDSDNEGRTVLHKACQEGKLQLVQYLIEKFSTLLAIKDVAGKSSFLNAGYSGSVELVKYMIDSGCDVYDMDNNGMNVLHCACQEGNVELVQYFIDEFSDMLKIRDKTGQSPFLTSGFSGSVELVKYLISRGCDVYDKDNDGRTVLHKVCQEGHIELVQYIVENYPDMLKIRDKVGLTSLIITGLSGSVDLMKYFMSRGCDIYEKDNDGWTVLHIACERGHLELVRYLVENFPGLLKVRNKRRQSPLKLAESSSSLHVVEYLQLNAHSNKEWDTRCVVIVAIVTCFLVRSLYNC